MKQPSVLSIQAIQRMPLYLSYLKRMKENGEETIPAARVAEFLQIGEIQVRKDFSAVSAEAGKPKTGFSIDALITGIERCLGMHNAKDAALAGVGRLGEALLHYRGFEALGLNIAVAFDTSAQAREKQPEDKPVLPAEQISRVCRRLRIRLGILTVPPDQAQLVCDQLVAGGVKGIWNFTGEQLSVPEDVLVQNENLAASLAILSRHLEERLREEDV